MPNFKLECEHRNPWDQTLDVRNTSEFEYEQLQDVVMAFEDFLRGCGFVFDGHLEIVEEETECGNECDSCDINDVQAALESRIRWTQVVNSLANPPKFRANEESLPHCPVCGITRVEMRGHKCWDKRCPLPESAVNANQG
jgi:hypothetical protein